MSRSAARGRRCVAVVRRPGPPGHALPAPGLAGHRAQPLPAGRGRRRAHPRRPVRRRPRLRRRASPSTSPRRPTTSPAAGRSPWSSSAYVAGRVRPGRQADRGRRRRHGRGVVVHRHVASSRSPGCCCSDPAHGGRRAAPGDPGRRPVGRPAHAVRAAAGDAACSAGSSPSGRRLMSRPQPPDRSSSGAGSGWSSSRRWSSRSSPPSSSGSTTSRSSAGRSTTRRPPSQSVREIVVQPQRGLIVDARAARSSPTAPSWVVSVDRTMLGKMTEHQRTVLLEPGRPARSTAAPADPQAAGHLRRPRQRRAAPAGTARPTSRCRSRTDVAKQRSRCGSSSSRRTTPAVAGRAAERPRLPAPLRHQPRPRARLPQPDHRGRVRPRRGATATARSTAPRPSAAPASRSSTTRGCAGCPATAGSPSTRWAGCSATTARSPASPGDTLVTSIDAKVQACRREPARRDDQTARAPTTRSPARKYVADSGAAVVLEARRPAGSSRWPASRRTTPTSGSAASARTSCARLYSEKAGTPLLSPRDPGPVRARLDVEAVHDRGRAHQRLLRRTPVLDCSSGFQVGNRVFKNYESGAYGYDRLRPGARGLLQHLLLPGRLRLLAEVRLRPEPTSTPATRWSRRPRRSASAARTGIDLPGEAPGRIADRHWKLDYYESHEGLLLRASRSKPQDARPATSSTRSPASSASRATPTAPATR